MLKINLAFLGLILSLVQIYAQSFMIDSTKIYKKKTLSLDEVNILSSYYHQEGNHSAITGGIGTEKLSDFANVIDLKLNKYNGQGKKFTYGAEIGVDYYTSASSDKIDTKVSSASSSDVRFYPSVNYSVDNEKTGVVIGGNIAFSKEYDYTSIGGGANFTKKSKNENTEFSAKANIFLDTYSQIVPSEFRANLIDYTKTYFPTTFNDFSPASPGMMFMEMASYVGDVLSFYLDNQVQENYLQFARQSNNLFELADTFLKYFNNYFSKPLFYKYLVVPIQFSVMKI